MNKGQKEEYWLGTGKNYSILEVAKMFSSSIEIIPSRPGERNKTEINLNSMIKLGWKAKMDLKDYIGRIN